MSLKDTYIVFLCTFDPVGLGLPVYTVRQTYEEADGYDDGTCRILYNATKWEAYKDDQIRAVLKYMQTGFAESSLVRDIDSAIETERELQAMRDEYMTYDMKLCEVRDETSHDTRIDMAKRALECGIPVDTVSKFTGLPIEDVEALL